MIKLFILSSAIWINFSASQRVAAQGVETTTPAVKVHGQYLTEKQKVEQLLQYISNLQGATFIRNGNKYSPEEAAQHLASKFRKHAKKIKTAHDFIDHLASRSSVSGEAYQIRMADGSVVETGKLLNSELERIEGQNKTE